MKNYKNIIVLAIFILLSGVVPFVTNLFFLQQYNYPKIRGNHVGLSALSWVVFWLIVLTIRYVYRNHEGQK